MIYELQEIFVNALLYCSVVWEFGRIRQRAGSLQISVSANFAIADIDFDRLEEKRLTAGWVSTFWGREYSGKLFTELC